MLEVRRQKNFYKRLELVKKIVIIFPHIGFKKWFKHESIKALKPRENQEIESIEGIFPKNMRTIEIKNELHEIKKWEKKFEWKDLKYKTNKHTYDF